MANPGSKIIIFGERQVEVIKMGYKTRGRHWDRDPNGIPVPGSIFGPGIGTGIDFWKPGSRPGSRFFLLNFIYFFGFFFQNNFWKFDCFSQIFFLKWNSSFNRSKKLKSEASKVYPRFLKKSWRSKKGPKIAKLFPWFLTTWFKLLFQI